MNRNKHNHGDKEGGTAGVRFGFAVAPSIEPRVLIRRNSSLVEFFCRVMYIVFLAYCMLVIAAGILSIYAIVGQVLIGPATPGSWAVSMAFILLLFSLGRVRDFWARNFDLHRMDANFSGVGYMDAHLSNPRWEEAVALFDSISGEGLSPIDKEALRRELAKLARENPAIYEAIYELSDERLRWTLVNAEI